MPRTRKRSEHYVNNKEFLNAIVIYRNQCKRAEEAGEDPVMFENVMIRNGGMGAIKVIPWAVSYTHLTLPTRIFV